VSFEGPAAIADWVRSRNHTLEFTRFYEGAPLPSLTAFDWLLVMGGPMSVHDVREHRWLAQEKQLIRSAMESGKVVVGVCLGAQLIADTLGARVYRGNHREIGWYDVELTPDGAQSPLFRGLPASIRAFHWHADTYELPDGAVRLAGNRAFSEQAFSFGGRVLGMQFHLESTEDSVRRMVGEGVGDPGEGPFVQRVEEILSEPVRDFRRMHRSMRHIFDRLAGL
jgi:GMP synthase (glutamine-hydrolysing)